MASGSAVELAAEGREAFERGDAEAARRAFEAALAEREDGELLEGLARARYLDTDYKGSMDAHERAFAAFKEEGDALGAARAARLLSWLYVNVLGDFAVAAGWLARAQSLLESAPEESAETGWLELMSATAKPHGDEREQLLRAALETGKRSQDLDLRFAALAQLGETLVMNGELDEGMRSFDESLAAICGGEVRDLYVIEGVFCDMFLTCERVHDVARAEQWLRAAAELIERRKLFPIGPLCRAHYGGLLMAAGRWEEAEAALAEAASEFEGGYSGARVIVLVRLADLRVRQGRMEEAAVLLEGLDQMPDAARPLAALQLAKGEAAVARELLERRLAMPAMPAPWPIANNQPAPAPVAAPLLGLLADVHLSEGEAEAASEAAERLEQLAERHPSPYLQALAFLTRGKVCLALGSDDAEKCLRAALEAFSQAQMPVELARVRLQLAEAVAEAQPEVAIAEAKQALQALESRRAAADADAAAALLRSLGAPGRASPKGREPLTKREKEVLDLLRHGLSNPEIAERLVISVKTAEHHVGNILSKLDLRNRAEAAAYAARLGSERPGSE